MKNIFFSEKNCSNHNINGVKPNFNAQIFPLFVKYTDIL